MGIGLPKSSAAERGIYWLAIGKNEGASTYQELKHRMVVAQGWPDVDLSAFIEVDDETFEKQFLESF